MKRVFEISLMVAMVLACGQPETERTIVASTSIVADWVQQVAGVNWKVVSLVSRDGDSHTYEPSPQDVQLLSKSQLIVIIGAGLEHDWLEGLLNSAKPSAPILKLSEYTQLLKWEDSHHEDEHEAEHDDENKREDPHHEDEHEAEHEDENEDKEGEEHDEKYAHHHGEFDPHVWQSPTRVKDMVKAIMEKLISLDSANAQAYRQRTNSYIQELDKLDAEIKSQLTQIPQERRKLVVLHRAFGYFAHDYGFEQTASILSSLTTQARDPSAADVKRLVDLLKEEKIPAIFDENIAKNPITASIARDAGVKVAPTLYSDALGQPGTPGETYLGMMRYNTSVILEALK